MLITVKLLPVISINEIVFREPLKRMSRSKLFGDALYMYKLSETGRLSLESYKKIGSIRNFFTFYIRLCSAIVQLKSQASYNNFISRHSASLHIKTQVKKNDIKQSFKYVC